MSIRQDTLETNLGRFLARYTPPKDLGPQAQADEAAALFRAIDRSAPQNGYDGWWPRFEDALAETLRTRAWPTVGDLARAVKAMPVVRGAAVKADPVELQEEFKRKQLRAWIDRTAAPGMPPPPIAPHLVTRERLYAIGCTPDQVRAAIEFATNPWNEGLTLTDKERDRRVELLRAREIA